MVLSLKDLTDVSIQNFPGHSPVIEFDGAGGISMSGVARIEISGLEIKGPNQKITKAQAQADRLLHSNYFSGRGIAVWSASIRWPACHCTDISIDMSAMSMHSRHSSRGLHQCTEQFWGVTDRVLPS